MVKPGELFLVKGQSLGKSSDARPCVVIQVYGATATIVLLSGQLELMDGGEVVIYDTDAAFPQSGLTKSSYIPKHREHDIPIVELAQQKRLGVAVGKFKKGIEDQFGVTL